MRIAKCPFQFRLKRMGALSTLKVARAVLAAHLFTCDGVSLVQV